MILTCPNCGTRFALDPARLGLQGRTVRCARCLETWFAAPPADSPLAATFSPEYERPPVITEQTVADNPPSAAPSGRPGEDLDDFDDHGIRADRAIRPDFRANDGRAGDDGIIRNLPALLNDGRLGTLLGWGGLVLFVLALGLGTVLFARDITTAWPATRKLYDELGLDSNRSVLAATAPTASDLPLEKRLRLADLAPSQSFIDGTLTLVISGRIRNIGPNEERLPPIEVVLLDSQRLDLKTWVFEAPQETLKSGAAITFETRLENPPPAAQDIRVTFATPAAPAKPDVKPDTGSKTKGGTS